MHQPLLIHATLFFWKIKCGMNAPAIAHSCHTFFLKKMCGMNLLIAHSCHTLFLWKIKCGMNPLTVGHSCHTFFWKIKCGMNQNILVFMPHYFFESSSWVCSFWLSITSDKWTISDRDNDKSPDCSEGSCIDPDGSRGSYELPKCLLGCLVWP